MKPYDTKEIAERESGAWFTAMLDAMRYGWTFASHQDAAYRCAINHIRAAKQAADYKEKA